MFQEYQVDFEFDGFTNHGYRLLCPIYGATQVRVKKQRQIISIFSVGTEDAVVRIPGVTEVVGLLGPTILPIPEMTRFLEEPFHIAILAYDPIQRKDMVCWVRDACLINIHSRQFVAMDVGDWATWTPKQSEEKLIGCRP